MKVWMVRLVVDVSEPKEDRWIYASTRYEDALTRYNLECIHADPLKIDAVELCTIDGDIEETRKVVRSHLTGK